MFELLFDNLRPESIFFFYLLQLVFFAFFILMSHNFRMMSLFLLSSQNSPLYFHFLILSLLSQLLDVVLST